MSTGLGIVPFGLSAYGYPADDPASLARAKIGSARKIDARTRRYVIADDGGFEAMDETAQRVLLLLAFGVKLPEFVTPQDEAKLDQDVRDALAPLLDTRDPDIDLESVQIGHAAGTQYVGVRYKNLRTGTFQYVKTG